VKAALIPPKGYALTAMRSDVHLVLAQLTDVGYVDVYSDLPDDHYMILDNGAAEGGSVSDEKLLDVAAKYGADEIVVPDVMKDYKATLERKEAFFKTARLTGTGVKFMAVVQGQKLEELRQCVDDYIDDDRVDVIGIPRHLITTLSDPYARARLLTYIEGRYGGAQVHLLGTNPAWPSEIQLLAQECTWVRSCDSGMPYYYTIAGERLDAPEAERAHVGRQNDYFTYKHDLYSYLLNANIDTYLEWASGTEGTRS
jgi:hypothetical protein